MKILRWVLIGLGGLGVAGVLVLYGWSDIILHKRVDVPLPVIEASTATGAVARGEHLATLYGCNGCHERDLTGSDWSEPGVVTMWTANLTTAMPHYTDAQLARAIRGGVRADGSPLWGMPSESWIDVTDAETADLLAWLRTHPPKGEPRPKPKLTLLGRWMLISGEFKPTTTYVAEARAMPAFDAGPQFARGRYLAQAVCSECHGSDLMGRPGDTPNLLIAASYDMPHFTRLMRTGVGMDGKEHGLMTVVAKGRFSHFTDQDIAALHAYLTARAEKMP